MRSATTISTTPCWARWRSATLSTIQRSISSRGAARRCLQTTSSGIDRQTIAFVVNQRLSMRAMYSTDRELIAAMLAGDEAAFRSFFTAYFPRVFRFALPRLNGEVEAAKEVVQATLSKAMRNLAGYRGEAALFSWLCQICRRQIVDYLRANRR